MLMLSALSQCQLSAPNQNSSSGYHQGEGLEGWKAVLIVNQGRRRSLRWKLTPSNHGMVLKNEFKDL